MRSNFPENRKALAQKKPEIDDDLIKRLETLTSAITNLGKFVDNNFTEVHFQFIEHKTFALFEQKEILEDILNDIFKFTNTNQTLLANYKEPREQIANQSNQLEQKLILKIKNDECVIIKQMELNEKFGNEIFDRFRNHLEKDLKSLDKNSKRYKNQYKVLEEINKLDPHHNEKSSKKNKIMTISNFLHRLFDHS
jgi:hypothetical protein